MGFFDALFSGKKATRVNVLADKIWLTADAKIAGLAREIALRGQSESVAILLVAHFPDVLACLAALAKKQVHSVPTMAVLAEDLSLDIAARLHVAENATIDMIVAERHPLLSVDERLDKFADELPCSCRLSHHLSLEDPIMKSFGGEWVHALLGQLGMTEDEAIESRMVSRRVKLAQEKIEAQAKHRDVKADSAADWFAKNCPDTA